MHPGQDEADSAYKSGISGSGASGEVAPGTGPVCILIVDTDARLANSLVHAHRRDGYDVVTASSGEQAFRPLRDRRRLIG
ncbi:hypothetical protein [Microvirga lenta]|uniref:hypothetical protein n=1 Tax=Microvirga lenta TaxID=2881337 RepID=UPI001CFF8B21|nr:hypothetical protein [Microvirga lenta]MCB5176941.1 hypothetical protein [Microvirga lenta]